MRSCADEGQPKLRSFVAGIRNDQRAPANGLTLPYSSGKVEGTFTKIKMPKCHMYGRVGFDLLRTRVILPNVITNFAAEPFVIAIVMIPRRLELRFSEPIRGVLSGLRLVGTCD